MVLAIFCRLWRAVVGGPLTGSNGVDGDSEPGMESAEIKDDLTVIRGIGAATKDQLYAAGITSYAALASSTPEQVRRALKGSRRSPNVEPWIKRAEALAAARQP